MSLVLMLILLIAGLVLVALALLAGSPPAPPARRCSCAAARSDEKYPRGAGFCRHCGRPLAPQHSAAK